MKRGTVTAAPDLRTWEAWHKTHQPFELAWWQDAVARGHFAQESDEERQVKAFVAKRGKVLDIGCGPKPIFAPCTVIEPLADEYRKIVPKEYWSYVLVYAHAAEQPREDLFNKFDTVVCWNCLDHAIGWREILINIWRYAKRDARIAVATDFHEPFVGHPGFERSMFESEVHKRFTVVDKREPLGRQVALLLRKAGEAP